MTLTVRDRKLDEVRGKCRTAAAATQRPPAVPTEGAASVPRAIGGAMSLDERLNGLIGDLYEAALDDGLWPKVLRALVDFTGSQAATFWVLDGSEPPRLPVFTQINFDPVLVRDYQDRMASVDPTVRYLIRHPEQSIVHDGLVITEQEKARDAYYDWHRRGTDTWFRLVARAHPAPMVQAGVALHRTQRAGRYEVPDIERFTALTPHLERALKIGCRVSSLGATEQCTTDLLDRNANGVLLLDERKRVVYANRSATALATIGDGIRLTAAGLTLFRRPDDDRLQSAIDGALAGGGRSGAAGPLRAERPSGAQPYTILLTRVQHEYPALSAFRPAVCVVITDPDAREQLPADRLRAAFGLTGAETALAARLTAGETLRSAAETLHITYGTARTRLAGIFQKTETHRQAELIKLLLTTSITR